MNRSWVPSVTRLRGQAAKLGRRTRRAVSRILVRQRDDHVIYLAGSLAFFSVIALVPIIAVSLSLFASFINKEQEEVFYKNILEYVFPFSPGNRISGFDNFLKAPVESLGGDQAGNPESASGTVLIASPIPVPATNTVGISPEGNTPPAAIARKGFDLEEVQENLLQSIRGFTNQARNVGWVGLVFLIISGIWLFDSIEDAFNSIWRADRRRPFIRRFTTFWTVLTFTPLLTVGPTVIDKYLQSKNFIPANLTGFWHLYLWGWALLPYLLTWLAIWLLYVVVPNGTVAWRPAAIAALGAAILWEAFKRVFAEYVVHAVTYQSVYGSLSLVAFVLAWIYYSWWLILLGFEVAAYLQHPDWDQATPTGDLAPEISLLYAWGAVYETGQNFHRGEGGTATDEISRSLGLHKIQTLRVLESLEDRKILARDRNGLWYPALPLSQITWPGVAKALRFEIDSSVILVSRWLDSALRARGLSGYRQDTRNLPSLAAVLDSRLDGPLPISTQGEQGEPQTVEATPVYLPDDTLPSDAGKDPPTAL